MTALREFRKQRRETLEDWASRLGVSVTSLSRIERGEQWPERGFFERLREETGGEVTPDDFLAPAPHPGEAA
jgi:transcriptional regulator with XRE-family HTH domain